METVSAANTQNTQVTQTQQTKSAANSNNEKVSSSTTSFNEEMKNAQGKNQAEDVNNKSTAETTKNTKDDKTNKIDKTENQDNKITVQQGKIVSNDITLNSGINTTINGNLTALDRINQNAETLTAKGELLANFKNEKINSEDILSLNIQNLLETQNIISTKNELFNVTIKKDVDLTQNIGNTLNYENIEMDENDAIFFADIIQNNEGAIQNIIADVQQAAVLGDENVQKSANVSKALLDALQNTVKTGQAVRIDFGHDIAVIMRVSKDGSVMANFIPGDKAVENYLKNNIDFLKQRFDEEDIPYSQLSYSQHQQREKRQQNKENRNE